MKNWISERAACYAILFILFIFVLFHLMVIFDLMPSGMVWGGAAGNRQQVVLLEGVAIVLSLLMMMVTAFRARLISWPVPPSVFRTSFWIMFVLFLLNTLGNLGSANGVEKYGFAPLSLILALLSLRLALDVPARTPSSANRE